MDKYKFAEISTRPFPSILDVENPWIFGKTGVVINVSEHEDQRVINIYKKKKINYYHFPLNEESENMGWLGKYSQSRICFIELCTKSNSSHRPLYWWQ